MKSLELFSEPFGTTGGFAAEGLQGLLGTSKLDMLSCLVREAVQNSWDARSGLAKKVEFTIALKGVSESQRKVLKENIFKQHPPKGSLGTSLISGSEVEIDLHESLQDPELFLLLISDTGTKGLGGPIRPGIITKSDEPDNFVDLVFNAGMPAEQVNSGGTYGFGKIINYKVSTCHTVIIYSVTEHEGKLQHRLIAQSLGKSFNESEKRYTGRHWWGETYDGGIEPLIDEEAKELAETIGLPDLESAGGGTCLAILAPDLGGRTKEEACEFMSSSISWNFWPKSIANDDESIPMDLNLFLDGKPQKKISPDTSPFGGLARCIAAIRKYESGLYEKSELVAVEKISSGSPKQFLGYLALCPTSATVPSPEISEDNESKISAAPFVGTPHHVALMRQPELIVKYLEGPKEINGIGWVGVFKSAEEVDFLFAKSEPPTHDDWFPNFVQEDHRTNFVKTALREINKIISNKYSYKPYVNPSSESAVIVADLLGTLLAEEPGSGPTNKNGSGTSKPRKSSLPKVNEIERRLNENNGKIELEVDFEITAATGSSETRVEIVLETATGSGAIEKSPPFGEEPPELIEIRYKGLASKDPFITIKDKSAESVTVKVMYSHETAVSLKVKATAGNVDD